MYRLATWRVHRSASRALPLVAALLFGSAIIGCETHATPRIDNLYNRAAMYHGPDRNAVIVIPGILGSRLVEGDSRRVVWGAFGGGSADPRKARNARALALPMQRSLPLRELRDDVVNDGALDRLKLALLGLPLTLDAYRQLLLTLGAGGYRDQSLGEAGAIDYGADHYTCFQFDYDWRRDNVENARRLHAFIQEKRAYVAQQLQQRLGVSNPDVRFDIVAHSMGGLVAHYYLRFGDRDLPADGSVPTPTWDGAQHVDRLIMVGTPNAGSLQALLDLAHGKEIGPLLPDYPAAVLGTMPSIYQLLPRERHEPVRSVVEDEPVRDLYSVSQWKHRRWGLADPAQDAVLQQLLPEVESSEARRAIALDHLEKCLTRARQFHAALDQPSATTPGTRLVLFAGDAIPTSAIAKLEPRSGALTAVDWWPGDGTVTRASALLDERIAAEWQPALRSPIQWDQVSFVFSNHLGMTRDPAFADNVLYELLEHPR